MSYCPECGAYIPEGQKECLACKDKKVSAPVMTAVKVETKPAATETKSEGPHTTSGRTGGTPTANIPASSQTKAQNSRIFAVLSYLGVAFFLPLCILPFFLCKDDGFAKFHAKQSIVLYVFYLLAGIVGRWFNLVWLVNVALWYFVVKGILNAYAGKKEPLPWIGQYADRF